MKLVMTLLVRDEQDILKENIEFHLDRGVDEVILMDNLSSDETADIAAEYVRLGVLHYIFQPEDDYSQGRWVTRMARQACQELGANWVINNDADEFWWPLQGSLKDVLSQVDRGTLAVSAERTNFIPRPESAEPFWRRMNIRRKISFNLLGKPLPGKIAHRGLADVVVDQGNHGIRVNGLAAEFSISPISILHFPIRSKKQFFNKIKLGGAAYARNDHLDKDIGNIWRHLYTCYVDGTLDEVYQKEVLEADAIEQGLAGGVLIRDERLSNALAPLMSSARIDSPANTRAFGTRRG